MFFLASVWPRLLIVLISRRGASLAFGKAQPQKMGIVPLQTKALRRTGVTEMRLTNQIRIHSFLTTSVSCPKNQLAPVSGQKRCARCTFYFAQVGDVFTFRRRLTAKKS